MTLTDSPSTPTTTRTKDVVLGLAGLAFFVPLLVVIAIPHPGLDYATTKPPAASVITDFYTRHAALEQYQTVMHTIAALALIVFFTALAGHVRRAAPGPLAARLTLVGGVGAGLVMVLTMALVSGALSQAGAFDGRTLGAIYQLGWQEHFGAVFLLPLALVPSCLALRGTLPTVLAWAGVVIGVLGGVALVAAVGAGTSFLRFPVFFLLMLWVLVASVVALTRGLSRPRP